MIRESLSLSRATSSLLCNPISTFYLISFLDFCNHAWGRPDEQSDLDVLIVVDKSDEKPYKRSRKGFESLKGLKIAKDIIVYTSDEFEELAADVTTLCHKIKKEGIKLYEAA